jgi:hypothetical protein
MQVSEVFAARTPPMADFHMQFFDSRFLFLHARLM